MFYDWLNTPYAALPRAISAGSIILFILILKMVWYFVRRRRFSVSHSGGEFKRYRESRLRKILYFVPKAAIAFAALFQLLALAEPYEPHVNVETSVIDARETFYLVDGSSSMVEGFGTTGKSKAQVARDATLKFLRLRKNQKEFSCLWLFSNNAYRAQGCTLDSYAFRFKVFLAPLVLNIQGEGGTNLQAGLRDIISYVDYRLERGKSVRSKKRILLIITDAQITFYPSAEFEELSRRKIVPYLLWIKNPSESPSGQAALLVQGVESYGGRVFEVGEETALAQAFREIDARERSQIEVKRYSWNTPLFQKPLFASFILIVIALVLQFVLEIPLGERIG